MWHTSLELLEYCKQNKCKISTAVLNREMEIYDLTEEEIFKKLRRDFEVMVASSEKTLTKPVKTMGDMVTGDAKRLYDYSKSGRTLCGKDMVRSMAKALSSSEVNASMGRVCAAPTAGACGILPAAFSCALEKFSLSEQDILYGLLTASGIGAVIESEATISGAVGGCQAECGAAASMAAAGLCEMLGGDADCCFNAAAIALKNIMGLVCDPVAGLVESPCAKRNASGTANALASADIALSGIKSVVPFNEVVLAMYKVSKSMPYQLRETALGGIAASNTAIQYTKDFRKNNL